MNPAYRLRPPPNSGRIREQMTDELIELRGEQFRRHMDCIAYCPKWPWRGRFCLWLSAQRQSFVAERS